MDAPRFSAARLGLDFVFLDTCTSTNDEVATRAAAGAREGLVVAADTQTGGRGRRGRSWHSPQGENLYFSLLLRPALAARQAAPLTLLAGAALAQSLAQLGFLPRLKWPNDVLLDTSAGLRKVAGILTEMACDGERVRHVVIGVGINVNSENFPEPLRAIATSLRMMRGQPVERGDLLARFCDAFEPIYDAFLAHGPQTGLAEWTRHALLGRNCAIPRDDGYVEGVAQAVDETGALLLKTAGGETIAVHAGEVNWRG